ncbi:hypothetical protein KXV64_007090 [Aspergillus fumigatus]|nr:hypothetical protein KXW88_006883 [Aspergillus fumigatus]KAH2312041.1 hypothetical protein KXV47_004171 [Aspergillus fumigatus]KAH2762143.1 hypothetical protein KXV94_006525 [Aspergillus fumigatus]KAH2917299.1 hypothetical protein KXW25_007263 [Aspergillus fumigatus]KAH3015035.1 hypothetical protein KXW60_007977 [Aspergillus fumigatus]
MASHPLQAIGEAVGAAGADPRPMQLSSLFQGANDGPAKTAAKLTGVQAAGKRADDGPYFTNNEAIPFLDPAHIPKAAALQSLEATRADGPPFGAFGYFETTKDVSSLTKAHFLRSVGVRTPVFARFSTVTLGREFPDEARNPRGFAVKFYTGEGNYDIVGLNFPVFFCRDPIQGPDVIGSQYQNPQNFLLDHNSLFDLLANTPEGNHAGMMFFSDHGTPVGWRNLHGYGCHTFKVNKRGEFVYIKYHFIADRGQKQSTADEAIQMCGEDPDFSKRDLYQAIEKGEKISWTAHVQIMKPEEADPTKLGFDPFDVIKLHEFGKLVLNKNPENFHRDVEQAAFSPGSMVPGIEDSPDPLLQFRMFFYRDAQHHRIGVNLHQIPVNCPFMASSYSSLNFDGPLRLDANHAMNPQYAPNSFVHKFRPDTAEAPYQLADNTVSRKSHFYHEGKLSEYDQPRALYQKVMDARGESIFIAILHACSRGVYDLLPEQKFDFSQVKAQAQGAERVGKEAKFRPSKDTDILAGKCPATPVYNQ